MRPTKFSLQVSCLRSNIRGSLLTAECPATDRSFALESLKASQIGIEAPRPLV